MWLRIKRNQKRLALFLKAMWWAVVTLTTVGYGDVTPVTSLGKLLGALITILGVGIAALPAGILASGLANELNQRNQRLEQEFRELLQVRGIDIMHDEAEIERIRQKWDYRRTSA